MILVSPVTQHESIKVYATNQKSLNKIIGENIRSLQMKSPFTQKEFLEVIGFNQKYPAQYFSRIVKGEVGMSLFNLLIIQKTFTVTLEQLVTPKGV